jgi:DNA helicase HerA-like ATPase
LAILGSTKSGGTNAYAGLAASFLSFDGGGANADDNGKAHIFFGMDYFMDYNFYFNAEAHLFGEDTLSVGVGYLF